MTSRGTARCALTLGGIFVLFLAGVAAGQRGEAGYRRSLRLENVRWQRWEPNVGRPVVAPDGRVWIVRKKDDPANLDRARREITEQFGRDQPRLQWAVPVLFEKTGRIWFTLNGRFERSDPRAVLAYDGTRIIEKQLADTPFSSTFINLEEAGIVAFIAGNTVFIFDGSTWAEHDLPAKVNVLWGLAAEADGAGFVTYVEWFDDMAGSAKDYPRYWAWRNGRWTWFEVVDELPKSGIYRNLPNPNQAPPANVYTAFARDGRLYLYTGRRVTVVPLRPPGPEEVAELIAQLGSDSYQQREEASKYLAGFRSLLEPQLRQSLDKAKDPEVSSRLRAILEDGSGRVDRRPRLGRFTLGAVYGLDVDDRGNVCALVQVGPRDQANSSALIVVEPDGRSHLITGEQLGPKWHVWQVDGRMWKVEAGVRPRQIWLEGTSRLPALLIDLETDQVIHRMDAPGADSLGEVLPDGTVISRDRIAYQPDAPQQALLPVVDELRVHNTFAWDVAPDTGDIWAVDQQTEVHRYDGIRWRRLANQPGPGYIGIAPDSELLSLSCGRNDTALIVFRNEEADDRFHAAFYDGEQFHVGTDIRNFLRMHKKLISRSFAERHFASDFECPLIRVDVRGRIWYGEKPDDGDHYQLKVLVANQWIDLADKHPLLADPGVDLNIRPAGRSGEMLITAERIRTESDRSDASEGLLVLWEKNQPKFRPAPISNPVAPRWFVVSEQATWIGSVRLENGRGIEPARWKTVHFVDPDGCAWGFGRQSIFRMREDRVLQKIPLSHPFRVPFADRAPGAALFDAQGDAWVAMRYGVQRFERYPGPGGAMYEPAEHHRIDTRLEPLDGPVRASQEHGLMVFSGPMHPIGQEATWVRIVDFEAAAHAHPSPPSP